MRQIETTKYSGSRRAKVKYEVSHFDTVIRLNPTQTYQTILGFGGAFTEAAAYTLSKMSDANRRTVLEAYFNPHKGLGYTLGRVAIHSCDFALGNYTYIDENDTSLRSFSIAREFKYVIPMIQEASIIRNEPIAILASPWSPPAWMKTNQDMNHGGKLKPEYRDVWAAYYIKFIEAYKQAGINLFAITVQNEPAATQIWDSCLYTAEEERDFVKYHLGPALKASAHPETKLLIWDHNRDMLPERALPIYDDQEASQYVWGCAFHWYVSEDFNNLSQLHRLHPNKHLLFTEGCIEGGVKLGAYESAERYARNMIGDFANYCEGYIDWNLTLDEQGGPNHVGNYCDAPIICDTLTDTIHYNYSYDAIGHFSQHVQVGAQRIESQTETDALQHVAFKNKDGSIVLVLLNETEKDIAIRIEGLEQLHTTQCRRRSISTLIWRGKT